MKTNSKNTKTVATKTVETKTEKLLTIADVARELDLMPKRLRAMLRKNPKVYNAFRKTRFAKNSTEHKNAVAAVRKLIAPAAAA